MNKMIFLVLICISGCAPDMTPEQRMKIVNACNDAGMEWRISYGTVQCWAREEKK